jgi:hypothetical protein
MARYSETSVEIIGDDGLIDYGRFEGQVIGVRDVKIGTTTNNPNSGLRGQFSRTRTNNTVTFNFAIQTTTPSNCNCNCAAAVNCDC